MTMTISDQYGFGDGNLATVSKQTFSQSSLDFTRSDALVINREELELHYLDLYQLSHQKIYLKLKQPI